MVMKRDAEEKISIANEPVRLISPSTTAGSLAFGRRHFLWMPPTYLVLV